MSIALVYTHEPRLSVEPPAALLISADSDVEQETGAGRGPVAGGGVAGAVGPGVGAGAPVGAGFGVGFGVGVGFGAGLGAGAAAPVGLNDTATIADPASSKYSTFTR